MTYLEDDVGDVEDRQDRVVVVALETQVLFKPSQSRITDVCAVDEAEEVEQRHGGDDVQVNLPPQTRLSLGVELNQGMSITALCERCRDNKNA